MVFVLIQHIADHTFVDQNRFRSGRRREDQLSARVGFPFRHGGADTSGVIGEGTSRSLVVHDSGQGDTPADNGSESMDANVKHFFTLLGKMFFTPYGKEFFTYPGKQIFTS